VSKKITKSQLSTLIHEQEHTLAELDRLREALKIEVDIDLDEADPDLIEREKIQALIFTLERKLEDIGHAIARAEEQGYGVCERCGKKIDPERLEIFPETTLCIDCKRETERLIRSSME
jgi:DnaK suppressor protein